MSSSTPKILILDFGSQYTQLIARRVRESKVYCEIVPYHLPLKEIEAAQPSGIILSGGPSSVYDKKAPAAIRAFSSFPCRSWGSATGCS
ncbi:MAG: hypothetical protein MPW14_04275 [Candidatus Manganitrophus sp.]|nr:MAG: hypothetical protein MPW14_04275 [Candidatus Manganitrophus sp.]